MPKQASCGCWTAAFTTTGRRSQACCALMPLLYLDCCLPVPKSAVPLAMSAAPLTKSAVLLAKSALPLAKSGVLLVKSAVPLAKSAVP